jgi:Asp-tRNA(Asn)/Glu-tRNA(Gln) amidotransferase A subunit family amidase
VTPTLPLAGVRIVVKDNLHLKSLKVSLCNRAYYDTYGPSAQTAVCLQKLIDLGATILGQAKLNSFSVWGSLRSTLTTKPLGTLVGMDIHPLEVAVLEVAQ